MYAVTMTRGDYTKTIMTTSKVAAVEYYTSKGWTIVSIEWWIGK